MTKTNEEFGADLRPKDREKPGKSLGLIYVRRISVGYHVVVKCVVVDVSWHKLLTPRVFDTHLQAHLWIDKYCLHNRKSYFDLQVTLLVRYFNYPSLEVLRKGTQ